MANIIDLFETEDKRAKSNAEKAKMFTEDIIRSMKSNLEMKSEMINTSLEMYEEALKADGVRSGKLVITNLNEFIAMPVMLVFAELSDGPFVLLKEKIGNDIYLLGINASKVWRSSRTSKRNIPRWSRDDCRNIPISFCIKN